MKPFDIDIAAQIYEYHEECQDNLINDLNIKREYILKALKEPITIENYRKNELNKLFDSFRKDIETLDIIREYYDGSPF